MDKPYITLNKATKPMHLHIHMQAIWQVLFQLLVLGMLIRLNLLAEVAEHIHETVIFREEEKPVAPAKKKPTRRSKPHISA